MKEKFKVFFIALCLLSVGFQKFALGEKYSFHANGGVSFPNEKSILSGFESGFGFAFSIYRKTSFSFDFGFWKSEVSEEVGKFFNGKLTVTPFLLSLQYYLLDRGAINPYVFVGAGYVFASFKIGEYISIPEITINQKANNGLSFHAGIGGYLHITDKLALLAEAVYLYRKARGITTISDMNLGLSSEEFTFDMSSFILRLGIKYFV